MRYYNVIILRITYNKSYNVRVARGHLDSAARDPDELDGQGEQIYIYIYIHIDYYMYVCMYVCVYIYI